MSHSLTTADRRTHGKIFAVALAVASLLVAAGLGIGQAGNNAPRNEVTRQVTAQGVVKAAKPATTATRYYTVVR